MTVRVISKRAGGDKAKPGEVVINIARPSVLGNPFPMSGESQRAKVIEQYRDWLRTEYVKRGAVFNELLRLAHRVKSGENLALECWCAPCACHGDVIAEALAGINAKAA